MSDDWPGPGPSRALAWLGALIGLALPSLITWVYFFWAARYSTGWQQSIYLIVKTIQFAFPLAWVWLVLRERPRPRRPDVRGVMAGIAFSAVVVAAGIGVYFLFLRDMPQFEETSLDIRGKVAAYGIDDAWQYAMLAIFYSLLHSLLEEYYWRWFVFGQLRRLVRLGPAIAISAIAFSAHHWIVLAAYFQSAPWGAVALSAAVAVGGAYWAWLYERSGSLVAPWFSHLLIDAGIFWIGYDLIRDWL